MTLDRDGGEYTILVNNEDQYSIWRVGIDIPNGWEQVDYVGTKEECSSKVDEIWQDMRPRSLK